MKAFVGSALPEMNCMTRPSMPSSAINSIVLTPLSDVEASHVVLSPEALAALSEICSLYDKRLPDLLHEAINMALAHYGHLPLK